MKEFKTIENLEEKIKVTSLEIIVTGTKDKPYFEIKYKEVDKEDYDIGYSSYDLNNVFGWKEECFEIVNELAEEYKDKVMIDGQYCWQTCSATEHCKECNRLCNGSIDYYENYDFMAEEYNGGWIPCERALPKLGQTCLCSVNKKKYTDATHDIILCRYEELYADRWQDCFLAWMPLPAPYTEGE
jgi:hypothetical protein